MIAWEKGTREEITSSALAKGKVVVLGREITGHHPPPP